MKKITKNLPEILAITLILSAFCPVVTSLACPPRFNSEGISDVYNNPPLEAFMTTPEIIRNYNYPVESYDVITEDGYILNIFRIPYSKNKTAVPRVDKEPVLLQHGLVCSSDDWLLAEEESILPFLLSDLGFDVWLGNSRGNVYSQRHQRLSVNSTEFWDLCFSEMGVYDIPATFDFILTKTGKEQLSYVGHSMGTTMFFIAMDRHRHLQSKVRKMVALAPVAYVAHAKTPMIAMALLPNKIYETVAHYIHGGRILYHPFNKWLKQYGPRLCSGNVPACLCLDLLFLAAGFDYSQSTQRTSSIVAGHTPNDGSMKTLNHFLQWARSDVFQEYDYGFIGNLKKYGARKPPQYNLGVNLVETFVIYSKNDWLVPPEDSKHTVRELGNATSYEVPMEDFSHMDFVYAMNVKEQVYDHCIDFLLQF